MSKVNSSRLVREHLALKAAGVRSFAVRERMIKLNHLRASNFEAWVYARHELTVFEVIETEPEEMQLRLVKGNRAFRRDEITLPECAKQSKGAPS